MSYPTYISTNMLEIEDMHLIFPRGSKKDWLFTFLVAVVTEKVTHEAAKQSMLQGNTFTPNKSGSLIFPKTAFWFGLKPQMFYRQSSMFVDYLSNNYKVELQEFIAMLFDDMEFNEAFNKAFDKSIDGVWVEFIDSLTT